MADLIEQLRAYGRELEADPQAWVAGKTLPTGPSSTQRPPRSPLRSRRFGWVLITAVTAAVVLFTSSISPIVRPHGGAVDQQKTSGLVLGLCLFAAGCGVDAKPSASPVAGQPTVASSTALTADASAAAAEPPNLFNSGPEVPPGTYSVDSFDVPIKITVPAGWSTWMDMGLDGPDSSYLTFYTVQDVYLDACNWAAGKAGIGPTVDDLVIGLLGQKNLQTTTPQPLNIDGYTGVELVTTSQSDYTSCYTGTFAVWTLPTSPANLQITMDKPGEVRTVRILDLNGDRAVIVSGSWGTPTAATDAQIDEMIASIEIG